MEIARKKNNSKSKEFKTSFLFSLPFFLPLQTRSFHDFECQEMQWIYLPFIIILIPFSFGLNSNFFLFTFFSFILSFLHSFFSSMFYLSFLNDCQSNLLPNALAAWEETFPDCFGKRKLNEWIIDLKIEDLDSLPAHRKENVSAFLKKHRIHVECHDVVAFVISFWIQFDFN